jgi:hypothetical protein
MGIRSSLRMVVTAVTAGATAATMMIVPASASASASSDVLSSSSIYMSEDDLGAGLKRIVEVSKSVSRADGRAAEETVQSTRARVDAGAVRLVGVEPSKLRWSDAEVIQSKSGGLAVRVPAGTAEGDESAVAFVLNRSRISNVVEQKFSPVSTTALRLQLYVDGRLRADKVADAATHVVSDYAAWEPSQPSTMSIDWGKLNSCLASAGIPWATIALLSVACGIACAATAGFACAICLVGAGAGTLTTIQYCLREAVV